ncbi:MAG: hypothetical protein WCP97_02515 [bacterium]
MAFGRTIETGTASRLLCRADIAGRTTAARIISPLLHEVSKALINFAELLAPATKVLTDLPKHWQEFDPFWRSDLPTLTIQNPTRPIDTDTIRKGMESACNRIICSQSARQRRKKAYAVSLANSSDNSLLITIAELDRESPTSKPVNLYVSRYNGQEWSNPTRIVNYRSENCSSTFGTPITLEQVLPSRIQPSHGTCMFIPSHNHHK